MLREGDVKLRLDVGVEGTRAVAIVLTGTGVPARPVTTAAGRPFSVRNAAAVATVAEEALPFTKRCAPGS